MKPLRIHPRTTEQKAAADPEASVWVAANAGAGKTAVLTDRVARLLLAGTRPEAILCITFTKAAAAEMSNRLYETLAQWTTADDAQLRQALHALFGTGAGFGDDVLQRARGLFARVLDTPGGLRFQTIHSFCESLLKRFPLEAGVPPNFAVADDRRQAELLERAQEQLIAAAAQDDALGAALALVVETTQPDAFQDLLKTMVGEKAAFAAARDAGLDQSVSELYRRVGVSETDSQDAAGTDCVESVNRIGLARLVELFQQGPKTDKERAGSISAWLNSGDRARDVEEILYALAYTATGEHRAKMVTDGLDRKFPQISQAMQDLRACLDAHRERCRALRIAQRSAALLRTGAALVAFYGEAKKRAAVLDFDDLIAEAAALLSVREAALWVMWKLDGGLDHVLVDEAQDTNPQQWRVIDALVHSFFAGEDERRLPRSLFVVGDEKQSIFSFQGARPETFQDMQEKFAKLVTGAQRKWMPVAIGHSFRSTPDVLSAVDHVFAPDAPARPGVAAAPAALIRHVPHRKEAKGLVELWEPTAGDRLDDSDAWDAPVDQLNAGEAAAKLADRIARQISAWLESGALLEPDRPLRPGDIMILVRRRNALFHAIVRALKVQGVAVAGADRMKLLEQLAVQDLVAAGRFALLPDDDLNLAVLLKSPFFGLTDDDLFELCHGRPNRLWPVLRGRAAEKPHWQAAVDGLRDLLARADFSAPYEFYAHLLGTVGGRRKLLRRLGPDAADPIDEFMALALSHQRDHASTLEGFLHWLAHTDVEIKRDLEQKRDEVRVMTVHASKGLEAPVVFLPDTGGTLRPQNDPAVLWDRSGDLALPLWPGSSKKDCTLTGRLRTEARDAAQNEFRRLLYVALTRARDRLYICGPAPKKGAMEEGCWYDLVAPRIQTHERVREITLPDGGRVWRIGDDLPMGEAAAKPATNDALPAWLMRPAPPEPTPTRPLMPSRLAAEPAPRSPLGADDGWGFRRGRIVHRLLQLLPDLPPAGRAAAAQRFLARPLHGLTAEQQAQLAAETLAVLAHPDFAAVFAPGSRAEVPVVGKVGQTAISGQIDRLAVAGDSVLLVDFKTNRPPPVQVGDVAPAYLRQMALYRAALSGIFAGKSIRCALLWTDGPRLMELPDAALQSALLDAEKAGS
jgi:ATP-dependent helicase/nuclease subunit A